MPYISEGESGRRRKAVTPYVIPAANSGELNFQLTTLAIYYMEEHGKSYQTFNDISGAFTEALAEFRRRVVAPYEDGKIAENGDVY